MKIQPLTEKVIQQIKLGKDLLVLRDNSAARDICYARIISVSPGDNPETSLIVNAKKDNTTFIRPYKNLIIRKENGDIYFGPNATDFMQDLKDNGFLNQGGGEQK